MEIKFKNLSWTLKVAVIVAWFNLVIYVISFCYGFLFGLMGGI